MYAETHSPEMFLHETKIKLGGKSDLENKPSFLVYTLNNVHNVVQIWVAAQFTSRKKEK